MESWKKWYRTDSLGGLLFMAHVPEKRNAESSLGISSTTHSNYTNHNTKSNLIFYLKTTLQLCLFKWINFIKSMQVLSGRITSTYRLYLFWIQVFFFSVARLDHKTKIQCYWTQFLKCASCMKNSICWNQLWHGN